jgi:hypothetical protein
MLTLKLQSHFRREPITPADIQYDSEQCWSTLIGVGATGTREAAVKATHGRRAWRLRDAQLGHASKTAEERARKVEGI